MISKDKGDLLDLVEYGISICLQGVEVLSSGVREGLVMQREDHRAWSYRRGTGMNRWVKGGKTIAWRGIALCVRVSVNLTSSFVAKLKQNCSYFIPHHLGPVSWQLEARWKKLTKFYTLT